ncbi:MULTISPECIES: DUF3800 domain-containing protein [Metabacillus]|uniref:DUF3800 domain-containing protein n=1 Tax=Metabacillus TaxID=2675233 RepID=UPI000C7F959C|nr:MULTISPECIES: DUF3800 domain-containing protein [Metabacillus]MCM3443272.1 DUF3800 domain-containing protein [Metabacillus halosaccharovorans]PMC34214.1 hypothetical protein CJ195_24150 [Bacillus sp. UMB0899]
MSSNQLQTEVMNIFFDESGQDSDKPTTMGGLLIPHSVYYTQEMNDLTKKLEEKKLKLHWTDYTGDAVLRENIKAAISIFSKIARYTRMNVISYNRSSLDLRYKLSDDPGSKKLRSRERKETMNYATLMVYTKIPERIFYGLLRNYGKDVYIKADIYIEKEGKYQKYDLETRLKDNLNTQSLYRGEQYWVKDCTMLMKGEMIGIELVDLILGIIRLIIKNAPIPNGLTDKEYQEQNIKGKAKKHQLVIELLKIKSFYQFLQNIKYYEWDSHKELSEIHFNDYLDLFMAKNFREFE